MKKVEPGKALDGLHSDDRMTVYSLAQVIAALLKPYKAPMRQAAFRHTAWVLGDTNAEQMTMPAQ